MYYFIIQIQKFIFRKSIHLFMHSYYDAVLGFPFVTGLTEKLYKISYALSVGGQNAGGTPFIKKKARYGAI